MSLWVIIVVLSPCGRLPITGGVGGKEAPGSPMAEILGRDKSA
jgi:hypothetical protein